MAMTAQQLLQILPHAGDKAGVLHLEKNYACN